jgi:hypothetical protein
MPDPTPLSNSGSARFRFGRRKAFESPDVCEIDAVEDHCELGSRQLDARFGGLWKVVFSFFQSLAPKTQTVATPVENLDAVCGSVGENEQVSRQRIVVEFGADEVGESIESESQINGGSEPEFGGGWDGQHDLSSSPRRTATMTSGCVSAGNRTSVPEGKAISMGVLCVGVM